MHSHKIDLDDLDEEQNPASKLFRIIELNTIYKCTHRINFPQPSLDLGCGDGFIASTLFDQQFTYGLDNNEAGDVQVAIKKKRYKKVLIELAEKMSLPQNSVNFVFSNSVIEHIPDLNQVLSEVRRVLKPNGYFLFTVPSDKFSQYLYLSNLLDSWKLGFLSNLYVNYRNRKLNHYHLYSIQKWKQLLSSKKLKIIKYHYYLDKEALMWWDRMALEARWKKLFDQEAEKKVFLKYKELIAKLSVSDNVNNDQGAGLLVLCKKI